jgi:hypothetical protein
MRLDEEYYISQSVMHDRGFTIEDLEVLENRVCKQCVRRLF